MKKIILIVLVGFSIHSYSQENYTELIRDKLIDLGQVAESNKDFTTFSKLKETLKDAEIVMLGEQSHGDATTYETKIKLIKYLHQELGFDILAFESGFYDCQKAWLQIKNGEDVRTSLGNSIFYLWSTTKQFKPLAEYIDENKSTNNPLIISGFDNQLTGKVSEKFYTSDLKSFLSGVDSALVKNDGWKHLENSLHNITKLKLKEYEESDAIKDTTFINFILNSLAKNQSDSLASFWSQSLKSTKYYISDFKLKTNYRDKQMAENLIWLKQKYPNQKIICWGATSHFLYNSSEIKMKNFPYNIVDNYYQDKPMMGQYVKQYYGDKVFTIGFIAYEGFFGLTSKRKIKKPKKGSLEYEIGQSNCNNCFLDLKLVNTNELISRPLAHAYMKNDISKVMDGVIFNRVMRRPSLDRNFFLTIFPENKYIKPEPIVEQPILENLPN